MNIKTRDKLIRYDQYGDVNFLAEVVLPVGDDVKLKVYSACDIPGRRVMVNAVEVIYSVRTLATMQPCTESDFEAGKASLVAQVILRQVRQMIQLNCGNDREHMSRVNDMIALRLLVGGLT